VGTVRALTLGSDVDLAMFCAYLSQSRVGHRVFEEQGRQILEVANEADAQRVRSDYEAWRDGRLALQWVPRPPRAPAPWRMWLRRYPVVAALTALSLVCFPATFGIDAGALGPLLPWLTIVPVTGSAGDLHFGTLQGTLARGEVWRLVTPILIHFGVAHLLFNLAVVVEFGRRIERGAGSVCLLVLTLLIAVSGNVAQFLWKSVPMFGGLSGVAYGLFAYVVVRARFDTAPEWRVHPSFSVGVLVMLLLMSSGVTEAFGLFIANTAHWVGLAMGAVAAATWRPARRGAANAV
jgi:GlpG protein